MPTFDYVAVQADGVRCNGRSAAASIDDLTKLLRQSGQFLVKASVSSAHGPKATSARIPPLVLADLTERLEILTKAGFPIAEALAQISADTVHSQTRAILRDLQERVSHGVTFSEALSHHPQVFDEAYRTVVEAGEQSGALDTVLGSLAQKLTWRTQVNQQIKSAFRYPCIVLVMLVGLLLLVILYLIPRVSGIFERARIAPPPSTVFLLATKDVILAKWPLLVGGLVGAAIALKLSLRFRRTRHLIQEILFRVPVIGTLLQLAETASFVSLLSLLSRSGVMISKALSTTGQALRTERMRAAVASILEAVTHGDALSAAVKRAGRFPAIVVQMVSVGERSGSLDEALGRVQTYLDREIPRIVNRLISMLGPIMTIVSGAAVGFAVYTVISPILAVLTAVRGGGR